AQPQGIHYYTVAGMDRWSGQVIWPYVDGWVFGTDPNDQAVPVYSVQAALATYLVAPSDNHSSITKYLSVFDQVCSQLALDDIGCQNQGSTGVAPRQQEFNAVARSP